MSDTTQEAVIFDMDGLIIDSEPLWDQAELAIFAELGKSPALRASMPDTLGLRIDQVVAMWYQRSPWQGATEQQVSDRIITRALALIENSRPLLPGVNQALARVKQSGLKIGLASASPLFMLERVLQMFNLRDYFDVVVSAQSLPYSKPHPQVYLLAAEQLAVSPTRCTTLEDSFNGLIATKAARMRSIVVPSAALRQDARWALADHRLDSLAALQEHHFM